MPVLVLAGTEDLDVVRPLSVRLLQDGGEVRCYLDDDDYELRNLGCKLAVGPLDDEMNLEGALTNVHTFIPFVRDPLRIVDEESIGRAVRTAAAEARAAAVAQVAQTILPIPALSRFENPLGSAFLEIERIFTQECKPLCIFRTGWWWGEERPFTRAVASLDAPLSEDSGVSASVVPVDSLVELLVSADDREESEGTWEFGGIQYPIKELSATARKEGARGRGVVGGATVSRWMEEILLEGLRLGNSAAEEFGVVPRPLL